MGGGLWPPPAQRIGLDVKFIFVLMYVSFSSWRGRRSFVSGDDKLRTAHVLTYEHRQNGHNWRPPTPSGGRVAGGSQAAPRPGATVAYTFIECVFHKNACLEPENHFTAAVSIVAVSTLYWYCTCYGRPPPLWYVYPYRNEHKGCAFSKSQPDPRLGR